MCPFAGEWFSVRDSGSTQLKRGSCLPLPQEAMAGLIGTGQFQPRLHPCHFREDCSGGDQFPTPEDLKEGRRLSVLLPAFI